jgi:hypothetical protein
MHKNKHKAVSAAVMVYTVSTFIQEVSTSNLSQVTDYSVWGSQWFFEVASGKCQNNIFK